MGKFISHVGTSNNKLTLYNVVRTHSTVPTSIYYEKEFFYIARTHWICNSINNDLTLSKYNNNSHQIFLLNKTYNYLVCRRSYVCIVFVRNMRSKIINATHIHPFGNCEKQERVATDGVPHFWQRSYCVLAS